jgi:geranylgeranylglycerol-phosphate geranylgeranyltransferase
VKRILSFAKLARVQNNLIVALSVFVGAAVSGTVESWGKVLLACVSAFFVSAGGNSINDFFDLEIDRINKPDRPLPRGEVTPASALLFSTVLIFCGIIPSLWIRPASVVVAIAASGLLIMYSYSLKSRLLWGNLTVALVSASAFVYGGLATRDFRLSLIPAAFAFLFHLGREVLKDIEDAEGDRLRGASTLPIRVGVYRSVGFCSLVFVFLMILTPFPYALRVFSVVYLVTVVLGVDLVLLYVIWSMRRDPSTSNLHRLSNLLKADMLLGLAAIYLGGL